MRLDKLLSEVGYGSRKEVKQLLKKAILQWMGYVSEMENTK